jgi:lipopolysaccharide biosynthesis glycosyltransferase
LNTFCTIITADYLPFAKVLLASLEKNVPGTTLQVLVVDKNDITSAPNFTIHTIDKVVTSPVAKGIYKKYAHTNPDHFRWALKPVFISYLLQHGFDKVIFTDPDTFFVNNFSFLFDELDANTILLTPHWANLNPFENEGSLIDVMRGGLFNAGFVGVNKNGMEALNWWAEMCHYKTEKNEELGLFVDQKYLDILPVQFDGVKIIKHQGCNLASWNVQTCKREIIDGKLTISRKFEPVFIHFNRETIVNILNRNDKLLHPYLEEYSQLLKSEGIDLQNNSDKYLDFSKFNSPFIRLKYKLLLRTRFKRFLFKLAEKL